jgi:hypothetical protein
MTFPNLHYRYLADKPAQYGREPRNGGGNTKVLPPPKAGRQFDDALARQWAKDHTSK